MAFTREQWRLITCMHQYGKRTIHSLEKDEKTSLAIKASLWWQPSLPYVCGDCPCRAPPWGAHTQGNLALPQDERVGRRGSMLLQLYHAPFADVFCASAMQRSGDRIVKERLSKTERLIFDML